MANNSNLSNAKSAKNDEFYTQLTDIANELKHYKAHFKDKVVYCNCDNPEWSNFWNYFHLNFSELGLKSLIATFYDTQKPVYKKEYMGGDDNDTSRGTVTPLQGNGDFRNAECQAVLEQADVVVTNPPFSLFREFIAQLMELGKKFVIIGNKNAITYKEFFPLIRENKVWIGYTNPHDFVQPHPLPIKKFGNIGWFTNLDIEKRHEKLILYKQYTPDEYPKYDNYDAINVDKVSDIPIDYTGVMGVPITFLDKYNPEQFDIVTFRKGDDGKDLVFTVQDEKDFNDMIISSTDPENKGGADEFSLTSESLSDSEIWSNYGSKADYLFRWQEQICKGGNQVQVSPLDYFFPLTMRGCAEAYIPLTYIQEHGLPEYKSRQVKYDGHICQKTYHRLFIRPTRQKNENRKAVDNSDGSKC